MLTRPAIPVFAAALLLAGCGNEVEKARQQFNAHAGWLTTIAIQGEAPRVYFIGDSITASLDTSSLAPGSFNMGMGGDRAEWLVERVGTYTFLENASCIVMMMGINDISAGLKPDGIAADMEAIAGRLPAVPLVLSAVLPVGEGVTLGPGEVSNAPVDELNGRLEKWCEVAEACHFVPQPPAMKTDGEVAGGLTTDGVHLTYDGYALWRAALADGLAAAGCTAVPVR